MAARDFANLLQCAVPVFEGLFDDPKQDKQVSQLLFRLAEWHAFAKLRMHMEGTLTYLETLTSELGKAVRDFKRDVCDTTKTVENPSEQRGRIRRASQKSTAGGTVNPETLSRKTKTLNLNTYKWHALGDYARTIRLFGPTDIYSTQLVSFPSMLSLIPT
jgi:hypothetical protein